MDKIIEQLNMKPVEILIPDYIIEQWQQLLEMMLSSNFSDIVLLNKLKSADYKYLGRAFQDQQEIAIDELTIITQQFSDCLEQEDQRIKKKIAEKVYINSDLAADDIFYLGLPVRWPQGKIFAVLSFYSRDCSLWKTSNLNQIEFAINLIESNLKLIYQNNFNSNLNDYYSKLIDILPVGVLIENEQGIILKANEELEQITGFTKSELIGSSIFETLVPENNSANARQDIKKILADNILSQRIFSQDKFSTEKYLYLQEQKINLPDNSIGIVSIQTDITDKVMVEKQVVDLLNKQKILLDSIDIQIWFADDINHYGIVNEARAEFLGLAKEEIRGKKITEVMQEDKSIQSCLASNRFVFETKQKYHVEEKIKNHTGDLRTLAVTKTPILNEDNKVDAIVCTAVDITEQRRQEAKIKYASYHDSLTELYNRSFMEKEINDFDCKENLPISVIMIDLNGLKLVNDTYGHLAGDNLLQKMAAILKNSCRNSDIVVRWGGDEFVILLPKTKQKNLEEVISRINTKLADNYLLEAGSKIPLSAAIGSAIKSEVYQNIFDILDQAEEIMYKNKLTESKSVKSNIVNSLLRTLSEKSQETGQHSTRMAKLATKIAKKMQLSTIEINKLILIAKLHDIGKTVIPESILNKKTELTEEEWRIIRNHPAVGHRILNATEEFSHISGEVLSHHEFWDGSGYPRGLKGEEIPLLARIIAIVDAYDVMTNKQSYKAPLSKSAALAEIESCSGSQFDPELVELFIKIMKNVVKIK